MAMKTMGEGAYERYCTMQKGIGHKGKKLMPWKELDEDVQEQWERGALQLGQAIPIIKNSLKERPSGGKRV